MWLLPLISSSLLPLPQPPSRDAAMSDGASASSLTGRVNTVTATANAGRQNMSGGGGRQTHHNCDSVRAGEIKPRRRLGEVERGGGDESDTSPVMITELGGRCTSIVQWRRERRAICRAIWIYKPTHGGVGWGTSKGGRQRWTLNVALTSATLSLCSAFGSFFV